jgi:hypothetical protein
MVPTISAFTFAPSRHLTFCLSSASILIAASLGSHAAVLFGDNFDSGASPLWQNESGAWAATGGVYAATAPNNFPNAHSSLPFDLTNFLVDVDINGVSDGGIWLRSAAAPGAVGVKGVLLVLKNVPFDSGVNFYWHAADGEGYGPALNLVVGSFQAGTNLHVHVEVSGDTYAAFINGATNPVTTLTTNAFASGQVGLYDFSRETFDNFVLQTPGTNGVNVASETAPFVELRWQSSFGSWYQVQTAPAMAENKWIDQGSPLPGTGTEMSVMVEVSSQARFVRVQLLD